MECPKQKHCYYQILYKVFYCWEEVVFSRDLVCLSSSVYNYLVFVPHTIIFQLTMHTPLKKVKVFPSISFYEIYVNWTLSQVLAITLISRWCVPEALDDIVRAKSIRNFKLIFFLPSLSVSDHVSLKEFRTSWTFHTNKYSGCVSVSVS